MKKKSIRKIHFSGVFLFGKFYFWGENPFSNSCLPTQLQRFFSDKRDFLKALSRVKEGISPNFPSTFAGGKFPYAWALYIRKFPFFLHSLALTHTHSSRWGNFVLVPRTLSRWDQLASDFPGYSRLYRTESWAFAAYVSQFAIFPSRKSTTASTKPQILLNKFSLEFFFFRDDRRFSSDVLMVRRRSKDWEEIRNENSVRMKMWKVFTTRMREMCLAANCVHETLHIRLSSSCESPCGNSLESGKCCNRW